MNAMEFSVHVECYSGHRGQTTPRRFHLGHRPIDIVEVVDRWLAYDRCYFKVRDVDGDVYLLRHNVIAAQWELTQFRRCDQPA